MLPACASEDPLEISTAPADADPLLPVDTLTRPLPAVPDAVASTTSPEAPSTPPAPDTTSTSPPLAVTAVVLPAISDTGEPADEDDSPTDRRSSPALALLPVAITSLPDWPTSDEPVNMLTLPLAPAASADAMDTTPEP
jgi:hypothetical protein